MRVESRVFPPFIAKRVEATIFYSADFCSVDNEEVFYEVLHKFIKSENRYYMEEQALWEIWQDFGVVGTPATDSAGSIRQNFFRKNYRIVWKLRICGKFGRFYRTVQ